MQRYFVPKEQMKDHIVELLGSDAKHVTTVLRGSLGDEFIISNGCGRDVLVKVTAFAKDKVITEVVKEWTVCAEMPWQVTVAQSLPKGEKLTTVIQKCTEAGAVAFCPFISNHTIVHYDTSKQMQKRERWQKIAKEAAEQSHRNLIPKVQPLHKWEELLARFADFDLILLCYEAAEPLKNGLRSCLNALGAQHLKKPLRFLIIIGPEGGLTSAEVASAQSKDAKIISLGNRILRTETAALYVLACLSYESGELGGNKYA